MSTGKSVALGALVLGIGGGFALSTFTRTMSSRDSKSSMCFRDKNKKTDVAFLKVKGKTIKLEDLPADVQQAWFDTQSQAFGQGSELANDTLVRVYLAMEQNPNVTLSSLPPWSELLGDKKVTDADVQAFFATNKASIPKDVTIEKLAPSLRVHLENQRIREIVRIKTEELQKKNDFGTLLEAPCSPVLPVNTEVYPAKSTGKNELVFVTHAFCSRCRNMNQEVESAVALLKDQIKVVSVMLPSNSENLGGLVARGGFCSSKQGLDKYWKYAELSLNIPFHFETQKTGKDATKIVQDLGKEANLDEATFGSCLESEEAINFVKNTQSSFQKAGVVAAPALFLNGRRLQLSENTPLLENIKRGLGE